MGTQIKIKNITWDYNPLNKYDEEHLGLGYVGIPPNMLKRFINECKWQDDLKVPPHYYEEDLEYLNFSDTHECYNADTQIVLMKWLHDKRRNYNLEYRGKDPYWIFHDYCHSQNDVYGYEVSGIYAYIENQRLLEGAEMAMKNGIFIQSATVVELIDAWKGRFGNDYKIKLNDFQPFMQIEDFEEAEILLGY